MGNKRRKVLLITDISTVGGCSASVMSAVLPPLGCTPCILPTAVLSSHTGGFCRPAKQYLTDFMRASAEHYERENINFDAILIGWLADDEQAQICNKLTEMNPDALVLLDPVMADNGGFYSGFDESAVFRLKSLAKSSALITPNLTEALLLLGKNPQRACNQSFTPKQVEELMRGLSELCLKAAVLKGVFVQGTGWCNVCMDKENKKMYVLPFEKLPLSYPGTGDIFASLLAGKILNGSSVDQGVEFAAKFIASAISYTARAGTEPREGVSLENSIGLL